MAPSPAGPPGLPPMSSFRGHSPHPNAPHSQTPGDTLGKALASVRLIDFSCKKTKYVYIRNQSFK